MVDRSSVPLEVFISESPVQVGGTASPPSATSGRTAESVLDTPESPRENEFFSEGFPQGTGPCVVRG